MVILGIDPGYAIVGYGVVESDTIKFRPIEFGAVTTAAKTPFTERIEKIYENISFLIDKYHPDAMSIEKLYFNTNTTTAIDVAQARGVIILAAQKKGVPVYEYTPLQVKQSVTGYGRAEKRQVMDMVKHMLSLQKAPKLDDTADALALAICHGHFAGSSYGKLKLEGKI
ncbi:MAG: crossover junction endodeoxyribonuclease RuvC [Clostridia bacterium]|nr:crossover junction endodeoxyribonuclease RuvC [Clostridia bacterium]